MNARLKLSLALVLVLGLNQTAITGTELTKADIPPGLSPELKAIVEDTFSDKVAVRKDAVKRFEKMDEAAAPAVPFMLRLLSDQDQIVGMSALGALEDGFDQYSAFRRTPGLVQALVRASKSRESNVRRRAAVLLGKCGSPDALELLRSLLSDPNHDVRKAAVDALGNLGDKRAMYELYQFLYKANAEANNHLAEACTAERAIGKIGAAQVAKKDKDLAFFFVFNLLDTWEMDHEFRPADVREGAVAGLGLLRDRRAVPALESILKLKLAFPYKVRERAGVALAEIEGRDAAPMLKQFATDGDEHRDVRGAAGVALAQVTNGEIDDVAVVEAIRNYLNEKSDVPGALLAIAKHGKTKAVRRAAAIAFVYERDGAVDDAGIVEAVHLPPEDSKSHEAMLQIAKHGTTKVVRAAAQRYLSKGDLETLRKERLLVTPQEVSDEARKH